MEVLVIRVLESLLFPPGVIILLIAFGLLALHRHRGLGVTLLVLAMLGLYGASIPVVERALMRSLESAPALRNEALLTPSAQAIVVLGGGRYANAPEYDGDSLSRATLERLRYGAYLHRKTGLPIIVTGGDPLLEGSSEASLMKQVLLDDYRIEKVWTEDNSRNTAENARFTQTLLAKQGFTRVYLVTHAWHMPRALAIFRQFGIEAIPAPTVFQSAPSKENTGLLAWLPNADALEDTRTALHELLGSVWYGLRY